MGCEKTTNDAIKFSYHFFIIWCSTRFFRDLPPRFFAYYTNSMKIAIWIPVADLSLNQACIYHLRAHHKIEYTAQNNTNFYMFIYASSTPSSRKEYIWQKETIFWPHIYTLNVGTRKRLHDIPRFSTLFLGQEILIIIYRTYKISLAF